MNTSTTKCDFSIKELFDLTGITIPTLRAISARSDGRVLLKCFGECDTENVPRAMHLTRTDLMPEAERESSVAERRIRSPPAHKKGERSDAKASVDHA